MRKTIFANDEFYHIYNRGVEKRDVFVDEKDYVRFLITLREFNKIEPTGGLYVQHLIKKAGSSNQVARPSDLVATDENKLVDIVAYCLNSNHYHMILKQKIDSGISKFMKRIGGGYSGYFNKKYKRSGSLFQGPFKSIHIDSNEYLLYLSAYVNQNNFIHGGDKYWEYSSYLDFIGKRNGVLCNKEKVLNQFGSVKEYEEFVDKNAQYLKEKKGLNKYILEQL